MHYFIYKTTHINGKYYIGRHSTNNLNDNYYGSGRWVSQIKDRSTLTREILEFTDNMYTLKQLEEKYLKEHYGKPNCMNLTDRSEGFVSGDPNHPMRNPEIVNKFRGSNHWLNRNPERKQELRDRQNAKVADGTHNWLGDKNPNKDGRVSRRTAQLGRNVFQTNNPNYWRSEAGIHHWQNGNSPNKGGKLNRLLVAQGRHVFQRRPDGTSLSMDQVKNGTHNFLGPSCNNTRLANGTHPSQIKVTCINCKQVASVGMFKRWHGDNCRNQVVV